MSASPFSSRSPALSCTDSGNLLKLPSWCSEPVQGSQITIRPSHSSEPETIFIDEHRAYRIGSSPSCDIHLVQLSDAISHAHVVLMHSRSSVYLQDLCSAQGSSIDGNPLLPHSPVRWLPGSILTLGDNACTVKLVNVGLSPKDLLSKEFDEVSIGDEVTKTNTFLNRKVSIEGMEFNPIRKKSSSEHVKFTA